MACPSQNPRVAKLQPSALLSQIVPKLVRAGLVDDAGGRVIELFGRRNSLSNQEILAVVKQAIYENGGVGPAGQQAVVRAWEKKYGTPAARARLAKYADQRIDDIVKPSWRPLSEAELDKQIAAIKVNRKNPGFLPKSLFDRYIIRVVGEDYKVDRIQTLAGAEHKLKQVAKKFPCNSIEIVSEKFGTVVKSYRPSGGVGTPKVDKDNSRDYKVKEKQAVKDDVKYTLYLDGQEYATYDTKKEAEQVGKKEGGRVRVKEVRGNPNNELSMVKALDIHPGDIVYVRSPKGKLIQLGTSTGYSTNRRFNQITLGFSGKQFKVFSLDDWFEVRRKADIKRNPDQVNESVKQIDRTIPRSAWNPKDDYGIEKPVILDAPRALHKVYGPNWMKRPDAAELKRAFTKAMSARSKSLKAYKAYVEESNRQFHARRSNPELDERGASDLFETFHGVPSTGALDYEESFVEPDAYAELGDLIELWVIPIHGKGSKAIKIEAPNPDQVGPNEVVKLASSPEANQLYFIGGDQALDVRAMGFTSREERSNMFIGVLAELTYRAKKKFHKLKLTDYYHKLGEESGNEPILIYDAHSEKMAVAGGNYLVKDVGIVD